MATRADDDSSVVRITSLLAHVRAQAEAYRLAKSQFSEKLAPDFTLFQFLRTDELGLSRLIAWLLDPHGSHGQGARFLRAFVEANGIAWNPAECADARVELEARADRIDWATRRIDILVVSGGKALAIENKPTAEDQPNQLADYFTHLERLAPGGYVLIYLSGAGRPPKDSSLGAEDVASRKARNELLERTYESLLEWLEACRIACRAERVRMVIEDFQRHIERRFVGVRDMDETTRLAEMIAVKPEFVDSAWQIGAAIEQLRAKLINKLTADLAALATARGWVFSSNLGEQWGGVQFQFSVGDPLAFRLQMGSAGYTDARFGIRAAQRNGVAAPGARREAIRAALSVWSSAPLKAHEEAAWIWLRTCAENDRLLPLPANWEAAPEVWAGMADASVAKKVVDAAEEIRAGLAKQDGALLEEIAA